ncbi:MAG: hypothetical protein AAF738_08185 [Bacteroidota bacterium]
MLFPKGFFLLFFVFSCTFLCWQCSEDVSETPDVSDLTVDVEIRRFEQALFQLSTTSIDASFERRLAQLQREYPNFWPVFQQMLGTSAFDSEDFSTQVYNFITHPGVRSLYDTTQLIYKNIEAVEQDLETAFTYYRYYFPKRPVPEVVSYISEFGVGTFTYGDSLLGIGWDFFLGEKFPYDYEVFPAYLQKSMSKAHITSKSIEAVMSNMIEAKDKGQQLLDFMIDNGKILYIKSKLLPETSHHILLEWTPEQLTWMENTLNAQELWRQILKRKLLYSTRQSDFQKLITASPSGTSWMPPASPGKAANWIGWQIIQAYMERHPETSLEELIRLKEPQKILNAARYRP